MALKSYWTGLRRSFFAGLVVVVPVAASLGILWWLFNRFTDWLLPVVLREALKTLPFPETVYRVLALILFVALVTGAGWLTRWVVGRELVLVAERIIDRVPLLNKTYSFIKEVSYTMLGGKKTVFERVILMEYPRPGIYVIGFVTSDARGEAHRKTNQDLISVFLPTTPNPTSGYLLLVPRDQLTDLDMTVAEGMKMVISGGSVVPPDRQAMAQPALPAAGSPGMDAERAEAIVLRRQPVTESSLIVTWFSREWGKLKTIAKGARRPKGPFTGKIDLFYEDEIVFLPSRRSDLHLLHECFLVNPFPHLREHLPSLVAASYAAELVDIASEPEDPNVTMHELLRTTLGMLDQRPANVGVLLLWFELHLLMAGGWTPRWPSTMAAKRLLVSLGQASPTGAQRVRLNESQLADAREVLWRFALDQWGREPRSRRLFLAEIKH